MRVADICPDCAVYTNAVCTIYNGDYLSNINASPLDSLDMILQEINDAFPALTGSGEPSTVPVFIGQLYIDTAGPTLYIGMGTSSVNWGSLGSISTTTTTTTAP